MAISSKIWPMPMIRFGRWIITVSLSGVSTVTSLGERNSWATTACVEGARTRRSDQATSAEVNGVPSEKRSPSRSLKTIMVPSAETCKLSASRGSGSCVDG